MKALNLVLTLLFYSLRALGRSRSDLLLENVALPQQIEGPVPAADSSRHDCLILLFASGSIAGG